MTLDDTRYFLARMEPRRDAQVRALFVLYPEERWSQARWALSEMSMYWTPSVPQYVSRSFASRSRQVPSTGPRKPPLPH